MFLFTLLPFVVAAAACSFANADMVAPIVTLNLEPNDIEQLLDTAGKYMHDPDTQQLAAFKVLAEEEGGNLQQSINSALEKANVTDEQFQRDMDSAKEKLSSSKAKETADELEKLFLDGSVSFIDKVKKSLQIIQELPEELRHECEPFLQLLEAYTKCPFAEQCTPLVVEGQNQQAATGTDQHAAGGAAGQNQHPAGGAAGQDQHAAGGAAGQDQHAAGGAKGGQQAANKQQQHPCIHFKLLKVCALPKNNE
ncbi:hypothetical protein GPALN_004842 [Globodera pallida]|uniref:DUF148 domain-containing protein n=1 Tax=Globodera pallida TaxID=36090 RepID=A0A183CKJ4_GLOPA|nr:hypothetical protein GPALN_004842 [Globodera pallida]